MLPGAGFALWTWLPSLPAFAAGFVLWGAGSALRDGTLQALLYEELAQYGATDRYPRLLGRSQALGTVAALLGSLLASPLLALGGLRAAGVASTVAACAAGAIGLALPEHARTRRAPRHERAAASYRAVLRGGLAQVRASAPLRNGLILVSALAGLSALDEYVPLLARGTGIPDALLPVLVAVVTGAYALGGWWSERGARRIAPVLALGAVCLALGSASGHPAGMLGVAVAMGVLEWGAVGSESRLQAHITDPGVRATVTSLAELGTEVVDLLVFSAYAAGSARLSPGPLFALAAVPLAATAAFAAWTGRRRTRTPGN